MSSAEDTLPRFDLPAFAEEPVSPALVAGRYQLLSKTGAGTSAVVYRALDLEAGYDVAVKLFHAGIAGKDFLRREREFRVLADLRHPGLVEFRDAGFDLDRAYLVMQLVEGPTMAGRILCGPLSVDETSKLGAGIADALAYVHSRDITHRDLKPANIMLAGDRPLLTDFGLAYRLGTSDLTSSGAVVGTAAYMAPEQVRGKEVGPPADVYALGLILLECLTGYREYPGGMVESALARLTRTPEIPSFVPPVLATLLARMTDEDVHARPTAAEVATALSGGSAGVESPTAITDSVGHLTAATTVIEAVKPSSTRPMATAAPGGGRRRRQHLLFSVGVPVAAAAIAGIFLATNSGTPTLPATEAPPSAPVPVPPVPVPVPQEIATPVVSATLPPAQPAGVPTNAQPQGHPTEFDATSANQGNGKGKNNNGNNGNTKPPKKPKKDN